MLPQLLLHLFSLVHRLNTSAAKITASVDSVQRQFTCSRWKKLYQSSTQCTIYERNEWPDLLMKSVNFSTLFTLDTLKGLRKHFKSSTLDQQGPPEIQTNLVKAARNYSELSLWRMSGSDSLECLLFCLFHVRFDVVTPLPALYLKRWWQPVDIGNWAFVPAISVRHCAEEHDRGLFLFAVVQVLVGGEAHADSSI